MDWGKTTMQQAGAGVVQLQECKVPHWVRGNNDEVKIIGVNGSKQKTILNALALGNSLGNKVAAEVIALKDFDELEKEKTS